MIGAESDRQFGPDDLAFAENLAARVAVAIRTPARSGRPSATSASSMRRSMPSSSSTRVSLRISYVNQGAMDQLGYAGATSSAADATKVVEELDAIGLRGLVAPLVAGDLDAQDGDAVVPPQRRRSVPVEVLLQHVAPPAKPAGSWPSPATSPTGSRPRRTSAGSPSRSTPGRPS